MKNFLHIFTCAAALLVSGAVCAQQPKEDGKAHKKKIEKIAGEACDCTFEIKTDIPRDTIVAKINSCITTSIVTSQLGALEDMAKTALEAKGDTVVGENTTIKIYANQDFDEIQAFLFNNCPNVKELLATNDVKSDKSMSKNKKALEYYDKGADFEATGEYEKAIEQYKKAVKEDKNFPFAWDNMGLCYRKIDNFKEAIKCYEQSIKIDPKGSMPRQNLAVAYEYLKDYKMAGVAYEGLIAHDAKNPEGYYGAGRAFYFDKNYEKGVDYMFKAYKMYGEANSPYIEDAENMLGAMYQDLKEQGKPDIFTKAAQNNGIKIE
jgi:tetratricopeptide (TPR) repeat protein